MNELPSLADLRKRKRKGETLSRPENFRLLASRAAKRFHKTGWSSTELKVKRVLEELGYREGEHYWHNYKLHNREQSQFYSIDFMFPFPRIAIEVSPKIWHVNLGDTEEKDKRKKAWLEELGFRVYELKDDLLKRNKGSKARLRGRLIELLGLSDI